MADGTHSPMSADRATMPTGSEAAHGRMPGRHPVAQCTENAVSRARRYIEAHVGETLTLSDISRAACMSRFHLARRFRRVTGNSPMQYLQQLRILRAQELLRHTHRNLSQIAAELGFFDQSHFTRCFRQATGLTPGAYARRQACNASTHAHDPHRPDSGGASDTRAAKRGSTR